jgi:AraC family transcriptional regulator, ethanolamine operon transcriptional activator
MPVDSARNVSALFPVRVLQRALSTLERALTHKEQNMDGIVIERVLDSSEINLSRDAPAPLHSAGSNVTSIHAHDADTFCEALRPWRMEVMQLRAGPFGGNAAWLALGPVVIGCATFDQPMALRWSTPEGYLSVSRPGRGSDAVSVGGYCINDGDVSVAGPNISGETLTRGRFCATALSFDLEYLRACEDWLGNAARSRPELRTHAVGTNWTNNYLNAIEWLMATAAECGNTLRRPQVVASLIDVLLTGVNPTLATQAPVSEDREMRASRRIAVERAREYIDANLSEPIRLLELCKYARIQARSLEYGFREVLGLSPIAYIRAVRLRRARRLLLSAAVRTKSISEIALDCGFWHLSQFAVYYKSVFSESPSSTYRRTQAELPRVDRRNPRSTAMPRTAKTESKEGNEFLNFAVITRNHTVATEQSFS